MYLSFYLIWMQHETEQARHVPPPADTDPPGAGERRREDDGPRRRCVNVRHIHRAHDARADNRRACGRHEIAAGTRDYDHERRYQYRHYALGTRRILAHRRLAGGLHVLRGYLLWTDRS